MVTDPPSACSRTITIVGFREAWRWHHHRRRLCDRLTIRLASSPNHVALSNGTYRRDHHHDHIHDHHIGHRRRHRHHSAPSQLT